MSELTVLFTNVANSIRGKTGETQPIQASQFASKIDEISAGVTVTKHALSSILQNPANNTGKTILCPELIGKSEWGIACESFGSQKNWGNNQALSAVYLNGSIRATYGRPGGSVSDSGGSFDTATGAITLKDFYGNPFDLARCEYIYTFC